MISGQFAISGKIDIIARLRAEGYSQRYIDNHLDKYHYWLHAITEKRVFNKTLGNEAFVSLNGRYMESFLGNPYCGEVRKNLLAWGYIECDNSYRNNTYSKGYRIAPQYVGKVTLRKVQKVTMAAKLAKLSAEYQKKEGSAQQLRNLKKVRIRYEEALAYIDKKYYDTLYFLGGHEEALSSVTRMDKKNGLD